MYFHKEHAAGYRIGNDARILAAVANRYIADNPATPFAFRAHPQGGVYATPEGHYRADFSRLYPDAPRGAYAYAATRYYAAADGMRGMFLVSPGGTEMYVNGELVYQSDVWDERAMGKVNRVFPSMRAGWNDIFIKCKNLCPGQFWAAVSSNSPKWAPALFHAPFSERAGQYGLVHTGWFTADVFPQPPALEGSEFARADVQWYPDIRWPDDALAKRPSERLFGGARCLAWAEVWCETAGPVRFQVQSEGTAQLYVDGTAYYGVDAWEAVQTLAPGRHDVLAAGCRLCVECDAPLRVPCSVKGGAGPWLYAGPMDGAFTVDDPAHYCTLYRLLDGADGPVYWRTDLPDAPIRPCLENDAFGKWSYPHGVTLYGLLEAGRLLGRTDIEDYVRAHVRECVSLYPYSQWDKTQYGYPNINQQLLWFAFLDDVGSFGSLTLEAAGAPGAPDVSIVRTLADDIARFIRDDVPRTEDGAFFRIDPTGERTLWADDLYMSVPFLVRYAALSGDSSWLDLAARQFILYRKYLYMPSCDLFSHVYDFLRGAPSEVPWGRGNGWVMFSLSELMLRLPEGHALYRELAGLYRSFAAGVLRCQGADGMWRQVLNDPSSYAETSGTAMMICGLSRGVRLGLVDANTAIPAVLSAWEGLTHCAIDRMGNVHGVCQGSNCSFDPAYYRALSPITNDPHGVGIVLLAGVETQRLKQFAAQQSL